MKTYKLILFLSFGLLAFAKNTQEQFQIANEHYKNSKYTEAITQYKIILKKGYTSTELYFNLGNSYYKTENIGRAILNYEKALKLSPNDEDVLFNLKLANKKIIDKIERIPQGLWDSFWKKISFYFSYDVWAYLSIFFAFISVFSFFMYRFYFKLKKLYFYIVLFSILITGLSVFTKNEQQHFINTYQFAIVLSDNIYVKSAPNDANEDYFMLHEGTKVRILEEIYQWKKVRLQDGKIGWVKDTGIEKI